MLYKETNPYRTALCSENAQIALNYLAFAMTLPAWKAHKDFTRTMDMLNIIGADAIANEQVNQVLNMGNLWWAEMEKRTHPHLDLEVWSDLA